MAGFGTVRHERNKVHDFGPSIRFEFVQGIENLGFGYVPGCHLVSPVP